MSYATVALVAALVGSVFMGGCSADNASSEKRNGAGTATGEKPKTVVTAINTTPQKKGGTQASSPRNLFPATDDVALTGPIVMVTGRVSFPDGKPASSATVTLKGYATEETGSMKFVELASAITDGEGHYQLKASDKKSLSLLITGDVPATQVSLSGMKTVRSSGANLRKITKDIVLLQAFPLKGKIVNEKNEPVGGLAVHLKPAYKENYSRPENDNRLFESQQTTASEAGEFSFNNIASGLWVIGTTAPDYAAIVQNIEVPSTETITLKLNARGGTVRGHVFLKADGSPVPGMAVNLGPRKPNTIGALDNKSTTSTADGSFVFEHVNPEKLHITVAPNAERTLGMALPIPLPLQVAEGETTDIALFVYPGSRVTGLVYDKDTSEPLAGAKITLNNVRPVKSADSDGSGIYSIDNVFAGENAQATLGVKMEGFGISAGTNGFDSNTITALLPEDGSTARRDIPMVRMVSITGTVVSREEAPIPHAQVSLITTRRFMGSGAEKTPVDSDGKFKLETLPFTDGFVEAAAKGYGDTKSEPLDITTKDIEDLKIVMDLGATVQGKVVAPDGKPVSGAKVTSSKSYKFNSTTYGSSDEVAVTGEDGLFTMQDAPIKVSLKASKDDFADSVETSLDLKAGESRGGVVLTLREAKVIAGRVINSSREPVDGVSINAYRTDANDHAQTGKDGTFKLDGLPEGVYSLSVHGKGASKNLEGIKTGTTDLEIVIGDTESLELIGTVVDDIDSGVIRDFTVSSNSSEIKFEKQSNGTFKATGLQENHLYTFKIASPKYEEQSFSVHSQGKQKSREQTFRLGKGGIITGRVVEHGTGVPIPDVVVVSYTGTDTWNRQYSGPSSHGITDAEGKFVLAPVPSGETSVNVKPSPPRTEVSRTVQVTSAETADLGDIQIPKGGTIYGKVVRGTQSEAVPNYTVRLYCYQQDLRVDKSVSTDAEGKFEFTALQPSQYTLTAGSQQQSVTLGAEGNSEITLKLGSVTMSGTVTRGGIPTAASVSGKGPGSAAVSAYAQNGEYKLADIEPGTYEFNVGSNNATKETVEVPDQPEFKKDFVLPDGRIRVTVVDSSGTPVSGAKVDLSKESSGTGFDQRWLSQSRDSDTDANGVVEFTGLPDGIFSISGRKEDVGSAMKFGIQVQNNQTQEVRLQLDSNGSTLISVALSSATGQGLKDAWCYLYGPNGQFTHDGKRDGAGVMTIKNIPPGTYTTNVSYWSHSQSERQVEIKAGETATLEDVLYPAGAIHWTLKKADGSPAGEATVTVTPIATTPEERPRNGRTTSAGLFVERGLAAGTYQVTAQMAGKPAASDTFEVAAGGNTQKEMTVPNW